MSFYVSEQGSHEHKTILLGNSSSGTKAEIYAFGALLNAFSVKHQDGEQNLIDAFQNTEDARRNITPLFQSAKLSPFVCRLKEGQYTFANEKYKVEKYYSSREALHGLLYDAVFSVTDAGFDDESAFVVLSFDYNKTDPGFPFFYRIQVMYRLRAGNELTITTTVINLSEVSIPVSDGWHPYFSFGKQVDDLELFMNTDSMLEFDNRLLPTGNLLPYRKFSHLQKIGDVLLDNCFLLHENHSEAACTLSDPDTGLQLTIFADEHYPYLQVFIPQHRNSIAIENLSSLPDAFNNGIGLIILEASASINFTTRFVVTAN